MAPDGAEGRAADTAPEAGGAGDLRAAMMAATRASHSRTPGATASMPTRMAWETIAAAVSRIMAILAGDFTICTQATEPAGVDEMGVGKAFSGLRVGSGGVASSRARPRCVCPPPALGELGGEEGGWVALGGIDVGLRIGNDVRGQEGGERGARRVHGVADPEGSSWSSMATTNWCT